MQRDNYVDITFPTISYTYDGFGNIIVFSD